MRAPGSNSFTDFFISHPVFAWVINIVLILLGLTAFFQLQTRQYPATEGTMITIRVLIDGSAKNIENQVTVPLEDNLLSIQGLESMESETQKGECLVRLIFKNRAIDGASADVREAVSRTTLPENATVTVAKGDIAGPAVIEMALTGGAIPELHYLGEKVLKSSMESVNGVAMVEVSGGADFRMNVVLDPIRMKAYGVTAADVTRALQTHNFQRSAGSVKEEEREFTLTTKSCLKTPQEFKDVVVRQHENKLVRLGDVAHVSICTEEERVRVSFNGEPAVSLTLRPQSNANPIEISKEVRKRVEALKTTLPQGVKVHIALDKALFITDSVHQVYRALFEAIILVLLVVLVFLRSVKAALIPLITIPISLIGTFFIMYALGFTINVLSLLALVLAIGLVVDDAIVVLENIYRYIEEGKSPMEAAVLGAREIRFSVIAMTLTLAAVYAPIAMVSGLVGKVFKEFALTLAGSVIVSGFTALTLSPPMCARLLKAHSQEGHLAMATTGGGASALQGGGRFGGLRGFYSQSFLPFWTKIGDKIEGILDRCDTLYSGIIKWAFSRKTLVLSIAGALSLTAGMVSWYGLRKELSPPVDEGFLFVRLPYVSSKNLTYLTKRSAAIEALLKSEPAVKDRLITLQTLQDSFIQSQLKPWEQRPGTSCQDMLPELREKLQDIQGIEGYPNCPSESIIASRSSQYPLSFKVLTTRSPEELQKIGRNLRRALKEFEGIQEVDVSETITVAEYEIQFINQDRINRLGIDPDEVANIVQTLFRGSKVGRFEKNERSYPVHVEVENKYRDSLEKIQSSLYARGRDANTNTAIMVPLKEILTFVYAPGDPTIEHTMKKRSYDIRASLKPGYSLADVYLQFRKVIDEYLPPEYEVRPAGELKRYFDEQGTIGLIFALATMFIFLVMAAQFESVRDPLIILFSVPLALGGALVSLFLIKTGSLNIYSQIGLITLIGLITKHGILLVDFANQRKARGIDAQTSMAQACQLRLRPILMTTLAMVLGALPLAFASGAGSEARQQIGMVIVGGMTLGTLFTLLVVPIVYVLMTRKEPKIV